MKPATLFPAITLSLALSPGAYSQDNDERSGDDNNPGQTYQLEEIAEEVIVTGSRIRRDEFTSASPIQIIDGAESRELGLIDTTTLLQSTSQATGGQVDSAFTSFVIDNGPGSTQLNLRGLGPERVLLLLNSKRLAPGGVGGAPTSPDLETIPSVMIHRVEYLLDGASSIYGSDAVAGVVNVIMRKDFEGFEFKAQANAPRSGAGQAQDIGAMWGSSGDNYTFGIAGEYYNRERVRLKDRPFTAQCSRYIHETPNGDIVDYMDSLMPGTTPSDCWLWPNNLAFVPLYGEVWYTPNTTNIGIPNFSETDLPLPWAAIHPAVAATDLNGDGIPDVGLVDANGDGKSDVDLQSEMYNYNGSGRDRSRDFLIGATRYNVYAYGDYDLQNDSNMQLYFETLYARRENEIYVPIAPLYAVVPPTNPYNPCNQAQPNGVNCLGFLGPNFGSLPVTPLVMIRGDRELDTVELNQWRQVAGVRGDIPNLRNDGGLGNWSYDVHISYSTSNGTTEKVGVLENELVHSLMTSRLKADGSIVCDPLPNGKPCVPVNLFADSIYQAGGGTFASRAEADYLYGTRSFETTFNQTIASAIFNGDVWTLPWNGAALPLVLGLEWRQDYIDSVPNDVARDGQLYGFFTDRGAKGSRDISEVFIETEFLLLHDRPYAEEWSVNLSTRYTNESTYGSDNTYSGKMTYAPFTGITLRGTYGTSIRTPNAQEQFLFGTSGFVQLHDPCVVPRQARASSPIPGAPPTYDPTKDDRSALTLANCTANGVNPRAFGLGPGDPGLSEYAMEVERRGGQKFRLPDEPTLRAETSTSKTYGIVLDSPFFDDRFTWRISITHYDIEVLDSISLLDPGYIINDCYVESENNSSSFCELIKRDESQIIDLIDSSFININSITARGLDYNLVLETENIINDRYLRFKFDGRMTRVLENETTFRSSSEDQAGTPVTPEWEGVFLMRVSYSRMRFNWRANYIGGETDAREDYDQRPPCVYNAQGCRPKVDTQPYWNHSASFTYRVTGWQLTLGVSNVFDEDPPQMDNAAPEPHLDNLLLGGGYDLQGRSIFASVGKAL